jgi:signal transduction histidine kinase
MARIRVTAAVPLRETFAHAARVSAQALQVGRVGIWLFDENSQTLRCQHLFVAGQPGTTPVDSLRPGSYPTYIRALRETGWVCVDDAQQDPRTRELRDDYLIPLGITSMLDAPIFRGRELIGVVCHEHVGPPRAWTDADRAFAGSVAGVVALMFEQSDHLAAEQALRQQQERSLEAQKMEALGRLAAAVAHDVNNLLGAIDGLASLIERPNNERAPEQARTIREIVRRGAGLARQLLALGRPQSGERGIIDLQRLLTDLEPVIEALLKGSCELLIYPNERASWVVASPLEIQQLVLNLALNARDAMPDGGTLVLSLEPLESEDARFEVLRVRDDGVGMDPETQKRMFEPYFTTKPQGEGTGLGLSMVYSIVRELGGHLEVESSPGLGSTFLVFLPSSAPGKTT